MCRIRIQLLPKIKIPGRTTNDDPNIRSTFRITAGILRGAWLIIRALGAAWIDGGHPQGAGASDSDNACDIC